MAEGWVKLFRSADEHPLLEQFDAQGVWDKLLMRAQHAPRQVRLNGQMVTLERGQLAISVSAFAEKGGITRKRMRILLGQFRANQMIEMGQAKGHAFSIITICNYDAYQVIAEAEGQAEGRSQSDKGPTKGQARAKLGPTKGQQNKNERKDSSVPIGTAQPAGPIDLKALVFDRGVSLLMAKGSTEKGARSFLGKAIGETTVGDVLEAIGRAEREDPVDPVGYLRGALKPKVRKTANGHASPSDTKFDENQRLKRARAQVQAENLNPYSPEGEARVWAIAREIADGEQRRTA